MLAIYIMFVLLLSIVLYFILTNNLKPTRTIQEIIHLDYTSSQPTGKINLISAHKQWDYNFLIQNKTRKKLHQKYLKSGYSYNIDADLILANSNRNHDQNKVSIILSMIDKNGEILAKSIRPIIIPHQSKLTRILQILFYFPFIIFFRSNYIEKFSLKINLMNDFYEPYSSHQWTQFLQINLTNHNIDIQQIKITLFQNIRGLT
jgi:hypothetical protein